MNRNPVLSRLDVLVGEWEMTVKLGDVTFGGARTTFEWLEDGAFLVQRAHPGPPDPNIPEVWRQNSPLPTTAIIGLDDTAESFTMLYADARDVFRVYTMTFADNLWTIHRAAPNFHQRFTGTLDGDVVTAQWDSSPDGETWALDFHLNYTRLGS